MPPLPQETTTTAPTPANTHMNLPANTGPRNCVLPHTQGAAHGHGASGLHGGNLRHRLSKVFSRRGERWWMTSCAPSTRNTSRASPARNTQPDAEDAPSVDVDVDVCTGRERQRRPLCGVRLRVVRGICHMLRVIDAAEARDVFDAVRSGERRASWMPAGCRSDGERSVQRLRCGGAYRIIEFTHELDGNVDADRIQIGTRSTALRIN
ncbi:hypothetical protein C8J57DRAFT_1249741 [Mycena rebaudengoi]|nr:hypothetical protein C8J57DRAFT_1249741 [Mycena rebaudengoi]